MCAIFESEVIKQTICVIINVRWEQKATSQKILLAIMTEKHLLENLRLKTEIRFSYFIRSRDNSVGIAARYELGGPGIKSLCRRDF
jgi:hypothetical protein